MATSHVAVRLEPLVALLAAGDVLPAGDAAAGGGRGAGRSPRAPRRRGGRWRSPRSWPTTSTARATPSTSTPTRTRTRSVDAHHHLDAAGGPWPCSRLAPRRGELALRRTRFLSVCRTPGAAAIPGTPEHRGGRPHCARQRAGATSARGQRNPDEIVERHDRYSSRRDPSGDGDVQAPPALVTKRNAGHVGMTGPSSCACSARWPPIRASAAK